MSRLLAFLCIFTSVSLSLQLVPLSDYEEEPDPLDDLDIKEEDIDKLPPLNKKHTMSFELSALIHDLLKDKISRREMLDPSEILRKNLEDPMHLSDVIIDQQDMFNKIRANFTEMKIIGLRHTTLDKVVINLSNQYVIIEASIPQLQVFGMYNVSSYIAFVSLEGWDKLTLNTTDLGISVKAHLYNKGRHLQISRIEAKAQVEKVDLQLHGLSSWGSSLINLCSEIIFENIKDNLIDDLQTGFKDRANQYISNHTFLPHRFHFHEDQLIIDALLVNANAHVLRSRHEPLKLQPYISKIRQDLYFTVFSSELRLYRGTLSGLSTMRRLGDVLAIYSGSDSKTLTFQADFGFDSLNATYDYYAHVLGLGPIGNIKMNVKNVGIKLEVSLKLRRYSQFMIKTLKLYQIGGIQTSVSGLGSGDPATEVIINAVTAAFRNQLAEWIEENCKRIFQKQLDHIKLDMLR